MGFKELLTNKLTPFVIAFVLGALLYAYLTKKPPQVIINTDNNTSSLIDSVRKNEIESSDRIKKKLKELEEIKRFNFEN